MTLMILKYDYDIDDVDDDDFVDGLVHIDDFDDTKYDYDIDDFVDRLVPLFTFQV